MNDAPATDTIATLDPENPWLGLESYTEETRAYFHGRDEESAELARRVQAKLLTVLFGQSGLGKTSLLRAGLVPRLRKEGYSPVYVRIDYAPGSPAPAQQIRQAIFRATLAAGHWTRPGSSAEDDTLWEMLHHRGDFLRDAAGKPLIPLLIFDQFEEIFTLGQADDAGKARAQQFLDDLADLVENRAPASLEAKMDADDAVAEDFDFGRADYRVLITLREDYLAHLESVKSTMPSITQNRMRLARMTGAQALDAVVKPGGKLVTQEVAEAIVRFVAGGSELKNAEIEPSLLSLVCRELNTLRLSQHRSEISTDLLAGSRETILSEFYERALTDEPAGVRRVIEDELLTDSGYRESLAEERVQKALAEAGAAPDTLATLVNRRVLRIEERLDLRRVELTHDVLCPVVRASREQRHAREAQEQAGRELAAQREREAEAHRQLKRAHLVIGVCIALLILAAIGASFGFYSLHRAHTANAQATAARTHAETAMNTVMTRIYADLAPTGQSATLGQLAQVAVNYYAKLPASQMTTETEIHRGLALVRLGQSQTAGGHEKTGMRTLHQAQAVFAKLRAARNRSAAVTYGFALALYEQGWAIAEDGAAGDGTPSQQAAALLQPLAAAPHASRRVRQLDAEALTVLSVYQSPRQSLAGQQTARRLLAGLGALNLSDLAATIWYADSGDSVARAWLVLEEPAKAASIEQQCYALAGQVLARQPGNLHAMDVRSETAEGLGTAAERLHHPAAAEKYAILALAAYRAYARFDPSNTLPAGDWVTTYGQLAQIQYEQGDIAGALATLNHELTLKRPAEIPANVWSVMPNYYSLARLQAETGAAAAAAHSAELDRRKWQSPIPNVSSRVRRVDQAWLPAENARMLLAEGKPQSALARAAQAAEQLQAIQVPAGSNAAQGRTEFLSRSLATASAAALRLHRYPEAEALARQWLALLHAWPAEVSVATTAGGFLPRRHVLTPRAEATLANALALQGKTADAVKALAPALAAYAKEQKAGAQGTTFRHDYAYALYVDSLTASAGAAGAKQRTADLAQASKLIAGASKQAQQLSQYRYLASQIAAAQKSSHA